VSVGFSVTKGDFDARAGSLAKAVRDDLYECSRFFGLLTSSQWGSSGLVAIGYTSAEATTLIAAFTDLGGTGNSLYNIAHAAGTLTAANDFFFNAKLLTGVI